MKNKLSNFWYYNKTYVLIGIAVIGVVLYSFLSAAQAKREQAQYDYRVSIVAPQYYDDAELQALADALSAVHGKTEVRCYHLEIGGENQSETEVVALDMDLAAGESGAFFVADPQTFTEVVNVAFTTPVKVSQIPELSGLGFDELSYVSRLDY